MLRAPSPDPTMRQVPKKSYFIAFSSIGMVLVTIQFWMSSHTATITNTLDPDVHSALHSLSTTFLNHKKGIKKDTGKFVKLTEGETARTLKEELKKEKAAATTSTTLTVAISPGHAGFPNYFKRTAQKLTVDILSIGSQTRPHYLHAQQETLGRHHSVRFFVGVTEADDKDSCTNLGPTNASDIANFCRIPVERKDIVPRVPQSVIKQYRRGYVDWEGFLSKKKNPGGWLCAQKRPMDGLFRLLQYYQNFASFLPDYLFLMDDDTFMDLTAVTDYLSAVYHSSEPLVMAGCLIRQTEPDDEFTWPWGGWGTILSRASLELLLKPIHCQRNNATRGYKRQDNFTRNACRRLEQDQFNEKMYFEEGMTLAELMNTYVTTPKYNDYQQWTNNSYFCAHSDWIWGYFFNYYNVGSLTGDPFLGDLKTARMASYRVSETSDNWKGRKNQDMLGQCRYLRNLCKAEKAHICHYISPQQMYYLRAIYQQRDPGHFSMKPLVQHQPNEWDAVWCKHPSVANATMDLTTIPPLPVEPVTAVYIYPQDSKEDELKHFIWDGVQRSSKLTVSTNATTANVWIVDADQAGFQNISRCLDFLQLISQSLVEKFQLANLADWKVTVIHWDDVAMDYFSKCFGAWKVMDTVRVRRFKRSIVRDRRYNRTIQFVNNGRIVNYGNWRDHAGAPVQLINYGVRTDVVEGLEQLRAEARQLKKVDQPTTAQVTTAAATTTSASSRPIDIAHFWPLRRKGDNLVKKAGNTYLRDAVSEAINKMPKNTTVFVGIAGQADQAGIDQAQREYLEKLLNSKIVVVAQRDHCEDHYRLMEALASGAMVMTDPMLTLPLGLVDGESIVIYHSLDELVSKARYYLGAEKERLDIAMKGYMVAMGQHRSWHMMERVVGV